MSRAAMSCKAMMWRGFGAALCVCLAGCAASNVREDYLDQEFSPGRLPPAVAQSLSGLDRTPLRFRRMVVTVAPQLESHGNAGARTDYRNTFTLIDAGNGLVQTVDQRSQNDTPTAQTYALTYRGFLPLRSQELAPDGSTTSPVLATQSYSRIDPFEPATTSHKEIEFDSQTAYVQPAASPGGSSGTSKLICKWGAVHPAADIFSKFSGDARDLECRTFDQNGAQASRSKQAYLIDYGIALVTRTRNQQLQVGQQGGRRRHPLGRIREERPGSDAQRRIHAALARRLIPEPGGLTTLRPARRRIAKQSTIDGLRP